MTNSFLQHTVHLYFVAYVLHLCKSCQEIKRLVRTERQKIKHIKGFGSITLAGILAYAHPHRFTSLRKFLFYCGYTQASCHLKRYSRKIKPIIYQATRFIIMNKDAKYYPFYLKVKDNLRQRDPNNTKKGIDAMARNRLGTYLLKEVYELFRVENREVFTIFSTSTYGRSFQEINSRSTYLK